ncbi:MAG: hypothetical protein O7B79_04825 [SAR324 cluster bacterium]|nr:hypothetical protein [SAR324 cluster bacterium]
MNKSILVLEENSVIHGLVGSALEMDGLTLHHEFNPENFIDRAKSLVPDLILISNADQKSDYAVCRELRKGESLATTPMILLANSNEHIDTDKLNEIHVNGVVRKPFEASDLQQQVSRHLDMIDLIGSAYEYRKSQSIDDKPDPLADLQVLEPEVLDLLQEAAGGPPSAVDAPQVDSGGTLGEEGAAAPMGTDSLTETLLPEAAVEPVTPEQPADAKDGGAAQWAASGQAEIADPGEEEFEELGAEDLLNEELAGEGIPAPAPIDQSLDEGAGDLQAEATLDEIEVEIAEGAVDFNALSEELGQDEVALFETELDETPPEEAEQASEEIPMSVRRMMKSKPLFSSEEDVGLQPAEDEEYVSLISSEGELESLEPDLGALETMELREESIFGEEEAPAPIEAEEAEALLGGVDDQEIAVPPVEGAESPKPEGEDDFLEEYLGDDELDEDRILEAMQETAADESEKDEDIPAELMDLDETSEMDELVSLAEADQALQPVEDEEEQVEIVLDQDEEALMLSALDEEASFAGTYGEPAGKPAAAGEETTFPVGGEETTVPNAGQAALTGDSEDPVDQQLQDLEAEAIGELEAIEDTVAGEPGADLNLGDVSGGLRDEELNIVDTIADQEAEAELGEEYGGDTPVVILAPEGEDFDESLFEPRDMNEVHEIDPDSIDEEEDELAGQDISEYIEDDVSELEADAGSAVEDDAGMREGMGDLSDFEEELLGLKEEFEANPEGEKLSDLLAKEGIQASVDDLEFDLPVPESNMERAIGLSELPGGAPVAGAQADTKPAVDITGAMLDEDMKTRLSEVLDEMISVSVRKAVREEMPKLMEQLGKDDRQA